MRCGLDVDYMLKAETATIPGHTRAVYRDKSCSNSECDVDYTLKSEAATIPGHTRAVCCDELCSSFECGVGFVLKAEAVPPFQAPPVPFAAIGPAVASCAMRATR